MVHTQSRHLDGDPHPTTTHLTTLQVVERGALSLHGALEATLAAAPMGLVAGLRPAARAAAAESPQHARDAIGLADCLLSSCPARWPWMGGGGGAEDA